jgi:mono/diheme cytochrome c family protein
MKKAFYIPVIFIVLISACVARKSEPVKQKTFATSNESIARGEKMYMINCQKCHPAGEGGLGPSLNANIAPGFIKRFQVRHGLGVMPSFKQDEITRADLRDITKYIHSWKSY